MRPPVAVLRLPLPEPLGGLLGGAKDHPAVELVFVGSPQIVTHGQGVVRHSDLNTDGPDQMPGGTDLTCNLLI